MRHWAPPAPAAPLLSPLGRPAGVLFAAAGVSVWPILALALALRLAAIPAAGIEHPDELFQYLEQAHRLLFGQGVVPWEYRYGMRGGLLPLLLTGPMALGAALIPGWPLWALPRVALAFVALAPVAAAWVIGGRLSPAHGLIAAFALAVSPELIHFAPHALSEPVAVAALLAGYALSRAGQARHVALGGLLLGLGACLRFQYLPAAALLALPALIDRRTRAPLLAGIAAAGMLSAAADLTIGRTPFAWMVENVRQNIGHDRAASYGVAPPLAYLAAMRDLAGAWALPVAALALFGARRQPALAAAALTTLALHMAIGHKEYRFILLVGATVTLLAALGTAELVHRLGERGIDRRRALAAALGAWTLVALTIALGGRAAALSPPAQPERALFADLRDDAGACGVAIWRSHWSGAGGYTMLHRPLPLYVYATGDDVTRDAAAFNRIVAPIGPAPAGFRAARCRDGSACVYARPGSCRAVAPAHEIDRWLAAHDQ